MKRVLGVVGSPRRNGNTDILVTKLLETAQAKGAMVSSVFLNTLKILECDGCHRCWNGELCSKDDDMGRLYPRIIESDVIIFGTPVYWYGPTALMKGFIDRFTFFNTPPNRMKIKGKSGIVVIPFEEEDWETVAPVISFFQSSLSYLEMNLAGQIIAPGVSRKGDVLKHETILAKAIELGERLAL